MMSQQLQQLTVIQTQPLDVSPVRAFNLCSKCDHERWRHKEGQCPLCPCYSRRKANTVKHAVRVLTDLEDLE